MVFVPIEAVLTFNPKLSFYFETFSDVIIKVDC